MEKLVKHKWIMFVIIIVAVLVFDAIVHNVAIDDRGIVIGLGVDVEGEELLVTAQVLLQKNGGISSGGSKYVNISGKDKTIRGAYDIISDRLGMTLSLAHTMTIIVSRQVLAHDKIYIIKDFLTDDEVSDITGLAMSDGAPKDILDAKLAYGEIASLQLQRMLKSYKPPLGITDSSIIDFTVAYFAPNAACVLPIVHKIKAEPNSDQANSQVKDAEQLVVDRTAAVTKSGEIIELVQEANEGFSMVYNAIENGTITIDGDDNRPISVKMVEVSSKAKYSIDDMSVTYTLEVKCVRGSGRIDKTGNLSYLLSSDEKERFKEAINRRVAAAWKVAQENNADFWRVYEGFYQKYGKKWEEKISGDYLSQLSVKTKINLLER